MKRLLSTLLICLLLCGCAAHSSAPDTADVFAAPAGLYDPESQLERQTGGALRAYPLDTPDVTGMKTMGNDLLVFSGAETTTLTRLTGDSLTIAARVELGFYLDSNDPSVRIGEDGLSCYDPDSGEILILDKQLTEEKRITVPQDLTGTPILSQDHSKLYYCTAGGVWVWDLDIGIRKVLKELSGTQQTMTGLLLEDTVVQCHILEEDAARTILLSAENGQLIHEQVGHMSITTTEQHYYASFPTGMVSALVFGSTDGKRQTLTPADFGAEGFFLPNRNGAATVNVPSDGQLRLTYYDLSTGLRCQMVALESEHYPAAIADTPEGNVYILLYRPEYDCGTILRWDVDHAGSAVSDNCVYTDLYRNAQNPDLAGIAQCQRYAKEIGQAHGIEILLWKDAVAVQPWDYRFEEEYLVPVLKEQLKLLDGFLAQYPSGMLKSTASPFASLKLCLVRNITGTAESSSLNTAAGIQFFDNSDAYLAIAAGELCERTLYHELFHVMETHIYNQSNAFDQWDSLNPAGFQYDYDYAANASRNSGIYLLQEYRAFVDTYSMSYPKEDRARIMEYAMLPGNEALFQSAIMQEKLKTLCLGIREAYGLEESAEIYVWEQYLEEPLGHTK